MFMVKKIARYGTAPEKVPIYQRYWVKRKDGIKQRYWRKTKRTKTVLKSKRWEIYGKPKDLYKSAVLTYRLIPIKDFTTISAKKLLENPEKYGYEAEWVETDVEY